MRDAHRLSMFVLASALVCTGHVVQAQKPSSKKGPAPAPAARTPAWPLPPQDARVRFLASYHGVDDFKVKKPSRWKTALLGDDEEASKPSDTMIKPYGVTASSNGRIYVTDTAARRVFVFDPDSKTAAFVGEQGGQRLSKPVGVAVEEDGTVFVADATANRVFAYAPDGTSTLAIGGDDALKAPSGIAIDRTRHRLYVADSTRHDIVVYDTANGARVRTLGARGSEPGQFNFPTNLFVDRAGQLYVADTLNFRVQVFDAEGRFVRLFGTQGDTPGTFNRPKGVSVDSEGHVYVTDTSFGNFQIFDETGHLLLTVGAGGRNPGEFFLPAGMYIDERDRIYVADQGNARVQVFQYLAAR